MSEHAIDRETIRHLEIAAMFAEYGRPGDADDLARALWEARQLERVREGARRREKRAYDRDRRDPARWRARLARAERYRQQKVASKDPHFAARNRIRARRQHARVMADPARHAQLRARRAAWYRAAHPLAACAACERPVKSGHTRWCAEHLEEHRRSLARERQRRAAVRAQAGRRAR